LIASVLRDPLRRALRARVRRPVRTGRGTVRRRHLGPLPDRRARLLVAVAIVVLAAIVGGGYMWLRDSSLVAVQRVSVSGLSGADAGQIRAALTAAARSMTTLDVRTATLRAAVSPYPAVAGIEVSTQFPHGLRIRVTERSPIAEILVAGRPVPVAGDGTLLRDVSAGAGLPVLTLAAAPGGVRIEDPGARAQLRVLEAAPAAMLRRVASVSSGYWHGIVVHLRQGPVLYFGTADRPVAKWRAVLAVLATPATAGADYIDVSDPDRPAAGSNSSAVAGALSSAGSAGPTGTAATAGTAGTVATAGTTGTAASAGTGATAGTAAP